MSDKAAAVAEAVVSVAIESPDLLKPKYQARVKAGANPATGHCYAVTQVVYHLLGAEESPWRVQRLCSWPRAGDTHWYLRDGEAVLDPTAAQFAQPVPYDRGTNAAFVPGREGPIPLNGAAQKLLERVTARGVVA